MKMKRWMRSAAKLLAGILLLGATGCGNHPQKEAGSQSSVSENTSVSSKGEDGQEVVTGRYVEVQKNTPEGLVKLEDMVRLSDGSIALLNPSSGMLYTSKDNGDSWESKELPVLDDKLQTEEMEVTSMAVAPDGGVFFSYVDWKNPSDVDGILEHYIYIDKEGNDSEIQLTDASGSFTFYLSGVMFTGERTLIGVMNGGSVYQIDLDAKTVTTINGMEYDVEKVILAGDYLLSPEQIYQISAGTGVEDAVLCDFLEQETKGYKALSACFDSVENTIYSASTSGLYSHVVGGSSMEKLLDGGLSQLGDPTKKAVSILKNDDGSFLIAYNDGEIDQYTYDSEAPSVPTQQLTVYSLEQNTTISKAVSSFRKSHPDVYVKQEFGLSGDYGVTKEDAIRNLNTRLLAGEGPDVLLLDNMPMDSYVEKGILADLSETVDALEKTDAYFSNILRAYQEEESIYALPIRYFVPVMAGETGNVENISDLASLAEAVKIARDAYPDSETVMGTYTAEELLKQLYLIAADAFQKDGKPDPEAIRMFLAKALEIYEQEHKNVTEAMLQQRNESMVWREENDMMESIENVAFDTNQVFNLMAKVQLLAFGRFTGMDDFQFCNALPKNKDTLVWKVLPGASGNIFAPNGIVGVNEKCGDKELAVAFLQETLGKDVQKADLGDGFPVNMDAFDLFAVNPNPEMHMGFSASTVDENGKKESVQYSAEWPEQKEIDALKEQIGKLNIPSLIDDVMETAVMESGVKVLEGGLGVDEGCDEIVQKVELYLAE